MPMPIFRLYVGITDVICEATLLLGEGCSLHVEVQDGVRQFEIPEGDVERLYFEIRERRRIAGKEL